MRRRLLAAGLLLLGAAPARAAATSWVGGAVGDFNVPGNWSAGVPGPSDDATIASAFVVIYATDPATSVNSLTLGSGAVLNLSQAFTAAGAVDLQSGSALQFGTTVTFNAGTLALAQGSSASFAGAEFTLAPVPALVLQAGLFTMADGSTFTVTGGGYDGGDGGASPTAGAGPAGGGGAGSGSEGGGGGGHGGAGGTGGGSANGTAAYDGFPPADAGAGGGGSPNAAGGNGGGFLVIHATTATVDGLITADGGDGRTFGFSGGGGGGGGAVVILAQVVTGAGTLSARGGQGGSAANQGGGGGGGGLIWVSETGGTTVLHSTLTMIVSDGIGGAANPSPGTDGTPGAAYEDPRQWSGGGPDALASDAANWNDGLVPVAGQRLIFGSSETANLCTWDLGVSVGSVTVTAAFSTSVVLAAPMNVTGAFSLAGGTVSAGTNLALSVGGAFLQTGGRFDLTTSTLVVAAAGFSTANSFLDARMGTLQAGGAGTATATVTGALTALSAVQVYSAATLSFSTFTLTLQGDGPFSGAGTVILSTWTTLVAGGGGLQTWTAWPGTVGSLQVTNQSASGLVLSTFTATRFPVAGAVTVSTGATLTATRARIDVGGDWDNYGTAVLSLSTVAFKATSGTQAVVAGGTFDILEVNNPGAVLRLSTWVVVGSSVGVLNGTLDLAASTISVRGPWTENTGAVVLGGTSVAAFDGVSPQSVYQLGGNAFGTFRSSCAGGVTISSTLATTAAFEWHRGNLSYPGATLILGGDMLIRGGILLNVTGSRTVFVGASTQTVSFANFGDFVDANTSAAGVRLTSPFTQVASFQVRAGSVLDAGVTALTATGTLWDTAFSTYLAISPTHSVLWQPTGGTINIGAGSVVNAKLSLDVGKTANLLGDLNIGGGGNFFDPRTGANVINPVGGSTIAFRGSANLAPSAGTNWTYGGDAADSWLVYEGSGTARGAAMSANPFGTLRVTLNTPADLFKTGNLNLQGRLIVEGGTVRPNASATYALAGDLLQTGGVVDFATASSGTVRMTGPAPQTLRMVPGSHSLWHLTDASTATVTAASNLNVLGDFVVSTGTFAAGTGSLAFEGLVQVGTAAVFAGQASTVTLDGATGGRVAQNLAFYGGGSFNGLAVNVLSANLLTSATAAVFVDRVAGSTLTVAAGATLTAADLRLGPSGGAPMAAASSVPGSPWYLNVTAVSSATAVAASDSNASPGVAILADDGRSTDRGGNVNWNFRPTLLVLLPGETFTPSAAPGKTGAPSISTAGIAISATVIAVSSRFEQAFTATGTVTLTSDDPFAVLPGGTPLVGGQATMSLTPLSAEPGPRPTRVSAATFFGTGLSTASVIPAGLAQLQIVLFGEAPLPGSPTGRSGAPFARVRGVSFPATVRAVDAYWNLVATMTETFALGTSASSATVPAPAALVAGQAVPTGLTIFTTGFFTLSASDVTNPGVAAAVSRLFAIVPPSVSSPTAVFFIPTGASLATLGGVISGTAADGSSVGRVRVDVLEIESGFHFDSNTLAFTAAAPIFTTTTLASPLAPSTSWSNPIPDSALASGRHYTATALVDDPTGFTGVAGSSFSIDRSALSFGSKSGLGSAVALPASSTGCVPAIATVTFTVGAAGISAGGAVAVRVPDGWTPPVGLAAYPPPSGYWSAVSSSPAMAAGVSTATVNLASFGAQTLGPGWLTLSVATNTAVKFSAGEKIVFTYAGLPPLSPAGRGLQTFAVWSAADGTAALGPISTQPAVNLTAGTTSYLAFADSTPLNLAPLQAAPTIQLKIVDLCGNDKPGASSGTVTLSLVVPISGAYVPDATAQFRSLAGAPIASVALSTGFSLSPGFTMTTSTSGPTSAFILATGSFTAVSSSVTVTALRAVRLTASAELFSSVTADTGTLSPGTTSAALSASVPDAYPARLVFTLGDPALAWDAVLSVDQVNYSSPAFLASGFGDPAKPIVLTWDGVDRVTGTPRYAAPGHYHARLRAGGGSALDRSLEVVVATTPGYAGRLGAAGARAIVRAQGPGAGDGAYAQASATGYFLLSGLRAGQSYQLTATTATSVGGMPATLSTAVAGIPAYAPYADLGTVSLPAPALVRVSALLPVPAPYDVVGGFVGRAPDGSAAFSGAIRFSTGAAASDDGGPLFGRAASTWSAALAPTGVYTLELDVPDLRLSTAIANVSVGPGGLDFSVPLDKRANVFGWAVLASTVPGGVTISVQATKAGATAPSVFGAVLAASSGAYALYGLDPGTWTVSASAPGFVSASSGVIVADSSDLTGVNLNLGAGGVIVGTATVSGNSLSATQCFAGATGAPGSCPAGTFDLSVEALAVGTSDRGAARVRLTGSPTSSTMAYAITGLAPGLWTVRTSLPGFALAPAGGLLVSVAPASVSTSALTLAPLDSRLTVTVLLPPLAGGACRAASAWTALGLAFDGADGATRSFGDATALTGAGSFETLNCSSATFFTPALPPGAVRAAAVFAPTGGWAFGRALLSDGATAALTLDLTASSVPAYGSLSFSGLVSLTSRTAAGVPYSVAATSAAGILANAPNISFCLLGSHDPATRPTLRVELIPYDALSGTPPLRRTTGGAGACASPAASSAAVTSVGFAAAVNADGSFTFPGVVPGTYLARVPGNLDDNSANGDEVVEYDQLVTIGTGGIVLAPRLARGARVSGTLTAQASVPPGRLFHVALIGADGSEARSADVAAAPGGSTAFSFDGVSDGRYAATASDLSSPRAFAAAPLSVNVAGSDVTGLSLNASPAGVVRARLAAVSPLPDGTQQTILITADNAGLLGPAFSAVAAADPAAAGGTVASRPAPGGGLVDAQGRVVIDGVPPGTYDVVFAASPNPAAQGAGALALAPAQVSGISVSAGQVVDLGVIPLFAGAVISGRVTDASTGAPVPGLLVSARPSATAGAAPGASAQALSAATDASGRYLLRGLNPVQRWFDVTAAPRGMIVTGSPLPPYAAKRVLAVDVSSGAVQDFALTPAPGVIIGRIAASGDAALSSSLGPGDPTALGAAVTLQAGGVSPSDDPLADLALRTNPDGSFVIPSVAAGSYRLTAAALGQGGAVRSVVVVSSVTNLGTLTLAAGGTLTGTVRLPDGTSPSVDEVQAISAASPDSSDFQYAALTADPTGRSVIGYSVGGMTPGRTYRLIVTGPGGTTYVPPEGAALVVTSTSNALTANLTLRPAAGPVSFRASRSGTRWTVTAQFPRPVRSRFASDTDPKVLLTTVTAAGALSGAQLSSDLRTVTAFYDPAPGEASSVFLASAALAATDWSSSNPSAPSLIAGATASLALVGDGLTRAVASNALGATLTFDGDAGRVVLPRGAFAVDAASSIAVSFTRSMLPSAFAASAPPAPLAGALYDVSLPPGVPTSLARPADLTLAYSTSVADPSRLHVYWYNPAAGAYVLQPDVLGGALTVDRGARTVALKVNHFSTYVLLDSAAGVIGGAAFTGGDLDAYNFPNPFDLSVKTVTTIHGGGSPSIRGTMVRISVPPGMSGGGAFRVFDVNGRLIRTVDLGALSAGQVYYQVWDGRNDAGADVASGLYLGQVELGSHRKTFKMAVLK